MQKIISSAARRQRRIMTYRRANDPCLASASQGSCCYQEAQCSAAIKYKRSRCRAAPSTDLSRQNSVCDAHIRWCFARDKVRCQARSAGGSQRRRGQRTSISTAASMPSPSNRFFLWPKPSRFRKRCGGSHRRITRRWPRLFVFLGRGSGAQPPRPSRSTNGFGASQYLWPMIRARHTCMCASSAASLL